MDALFDGFRDGLHEQNGYKLADAITPENVNSRLTNFQEASNAFKITSDVRRAIYDVNDDLRGLLSDDECDAWRDVFVSYWKTAGDLLAAGEASSQGRNADWGKVYDDWKELVDKLVRGHSNNTFPAWTITCLYAGGKYLRLFAIKADEQARSKSNVTFNAGFQDDVVGALGKHDKLEDAARQIQRLFNVCNSDRAPLEESRKWGVYAVANLLFKTFFKLNSVSLSKNILRTLQAARGDMPPLEAFPKSHQVTFKYYTGVIYFLEEDYQQAEEYLTAAYQQCHPQAKKNRELILTYLIPCHLLTTHTLPTSALLSPYPRLQALFGPLCISIKRGDLASFDDALAAGESEFVKRRIYLTLERGRDITLRNLLRVVFIAGGYEPLKEGQTEADAIRRSRIPVAEFAAAVRLASRASSDVLDNDEVECMLANMIYKNLMKGYISRERSMVVLSKGGAFPGTGV